MKNTKIQLLVGILLSCIFLYIALRPVQFSDLIQSLKTFNWLWSLPYIAISWLGFYLRAVRWKYLIAPAKKLTANRLFSPLVAGFGLNNLLPARLGEFVRAYILFKKDGVPFMTGIGTVVIERLFDMLMLLALLPIALSNTNIPDSFVLAYGGFNISGAMITQAAQKLAIFCGILFIGAVVLLIPQVRVFFEAIINRLPLCPASVKQLFIRIIHAFSDGLSCLKTPASWAAVIFYSIAIWLVCAASFQVLSYGFGSFSMTFSQASAVMVITCLAIILPAAPGFWGLFELGIMFGMLVLNIVPDTDAGKATALAYGFVNHILVYATIIPAGLFCLYHEKLTIKDVTSAKTEISEEDNS